MVKANLRIVSNKRTVDSIQEGTTNVHFFQCSVDIHRSPSAFYIVESLSCFQTFIFNKPFFLSNEFVGAILLGSIVQVFSP